MLHARPESRAPPKEAEVQAHRRDFETATWPALHPMVRGHKEILRVGVPDLKLGEHLTALQGRRMEDDMASEYSQWYGADIPTGVKILEVTPQYEFGDIDGKEHLTQYEVVLGIPCPPVEFATATLDTKHALQTGSRTQFARC